MAPGRLRLTSRRQGKAPYVWAHTGDLSALAWDGTDKYLADNAGIVLGQISRSDIPNYYLDDTVVSVHQLSDVSVGGRPANV